MFKYFSNLIKNMTEERGLEGYVLVGHEVERRIGYSCWTILKDGEMDNSWIKEVEK